MSYIAKAKSQQFTQKKKNLMKKVDKLVQLYNIDFMLIIYKNKKYYTY